MRDHEIPIRSFSVVFNLERRIHKVDRFRVPLPYGLPLRSVAYALAALVAVLLALRLPVVKSVLEPLPAPVRFVAVPVGASCLLTELEIDGRAAHVVAAAALRYLRTPRRLASWAAERTSVVHLGDVLFAPDEYSARLRRSRLRGPTEAVLQPDERLRLDSGEAIKIR